jgi:hypothetical protein
MSYGLGIEIVVVDRTKRDFANGLCHGWNVAHAPRAARCRSAPEQADELAPPDAKCHLIPHAQIGPTKQR